MAIEEKDFAENDNTERSIKQGELRIYGVGKRTKQELKNIASHLDCTVSTFLKPHLRTIIDSYPESKRKPLDG